MSRSKHTDPRAIRAGRRLRAPFAPRRAGDASRRDALLRSLKHRGVLAVDDAASGSSDAPHPLLRITETRPRPGHVHAAPAADVAAVLRFFGPVCSYGIRRIELVPGRDPAVHGRLLVARLTGVGVIRMFDQPAPPWALPGRLSATEAGTLEAAGAEMYAAGGGAHTVVHWPGTSLRDFMLFDGLMHEIGHHLVQWYTGKRRDRVMRTRDHEAVARRFALRCRLAWQAPLVQEPGCSSQSR